MFIGKAHGAVGLYHYFSEIAKTLKHKTTHTTEAVAEQQLQDTLLPSSGIPIPRPRIPVDSLTVKEESDADGDGDDADKDLALYDTLPYSCRKWKSSKYRSNCDSGSSEESSSSDAGQAEEPSTSEDKLTLDEINNLLVILEKNIIDRRGRRNKVRKITQDDLQKFRKIQPLTSFSEWTFGESKVFIDRLTLWEINKLMKVLKKDIISWGKVRTIEYADLTGFRYKFPAAQDIQSQ